MNKLLEKMQNWIQGNPKKTAKILIALTLTTTTVLTLSIIPTNQLPVEDLLQKQGLSEDLVLHYTFDNADIDRKIIDQSGNNHTGIINGEPKYVKTGNSLALKLDGKNDYIQIQNFTLPNNTGTIIAEIHTSNLSQTGHIIHTGNGDGWGGQQEIHLTLFNQDLSAYLGSTNSNGNQYGPRSRTVKKSFQASMSYENGEVLKLYQNGEATGQESDNGEVKTDKWPETTFIGKPNADKRYFQGEIKEIRVYDRKLTGAELRAVRKDKETVYMALKNHRLNLFVVLLFIAGLTVYRGRER